MEKISNSHLGDYHRRRLRRGIYVFEVLSVGQVLSKSIWWATRLIMPRSFSSYEPWLARVFYIGKVEVLITHQPTLQNYFLFARQDLPDDPKNLTLSGKIVYLCGLTTRVRHTGTSSIDGIAKQRLDICQQGIDKWKPLNQKPWNTFTLSLQVESEDVFL